MTPKFDYVVCSIEESKDTNALTIDELQSNLLVHKQCMISHVKEEQILNITHRDYSKGKSRDCGNYKGRGMGHNKKFFDKATLECYNCNKLRHFAQECPSKEMEANYVENQ